MQPIFARSLFNRRTLIKSSLATAAVMKLSGSVHAQDATPMMDDGTPMPAMGLQPEVLLTGLADPRYLAIDGSDVYFTESGTGGDTPVDLIPGEGTPAPTTPITMTGTTGKLSRYSADGTVTEIVTDFRSYTFGENGEIVGPAGVALDGDGNAFVTVGAPGPYIANINLTGDEGALFKVNLESGEKELLANLAEWEMNENPDPAQIDSNPYGAAYLDGVVYVADAGGNTIIAVNAESGEVSTFAITGGLDAPFFPDSGNPGRDGAKEIDSVPSCVVVGPDSRLYVSYVSGGPFPSGIVPVDAYSLDGEMERIATGLTMVSDVAFDSSGRLYACMISTDFIKQAPGQVVRIEDDGSMTVVIDGLIMPAGMEFDADDNLYMLIFSSVVPGGGQLVRYAGVADVVAEAAATPEQTEEAVATPEEANASPAAGGDSGAQSMAMEDTYFEPAELTIAANTDVVIDFTNNGYLVHDFHLEDTPYKTDVLGNTETASLTLNLEPGTYTYFCSQIGHRQQGMVGTLTVE